MTVSAEADMYKCGRGCGCGIRQCRFRRGEMEYRRGGVGGGGVDGNAVEQCKLRNPAMHELAERKVQPYGAKRNAVTLLEGAGRLVAGGRWSVLRV